MESTVSTLQEGFPVVLVRVGSEALCAEHRVLLWCHRGKLPSKLIAGFSSRGERMLKSPQLN